MRVLRKLALTASYITSFHFFKSAESEEELRGLSVYLPIVGLFIGAILYAVHSLLNLIDCTNILQAFLLTSAWLSITGCIHLDGLMDAADGLFSHRDRDRILEIMRDSRVGNFGAISGVMLIAAKICGLAMLAQKWMLPALILIPAWSRWAEVYTIASFPYARQEGMGKVWHDSSDKYDLLTASALPGLATLAVCFYLGSAAISLVIPMAILPGILLSWRINSILKGHTGDTYGAIVEASEAAALISLSMLSKYLQF